MENRELRALHEQAKEAIKSRRLDDAQAFLKKAIALDQTNVTTWLLVTYAYSGNLQRQQEAIRRAKQLAPTDARVLKRETEILSRGAASQVAMPQNISSNTEVNNGAANTPPAQQRHFPVLVPGIAIVVIVGVVMVLMLSSQHTTPKDDAAQFTPSGGVAAVPSSTSGTSAIASQPTDNPVIMTASALVQQMTATSQNILDSAQTATHIAQTTQTATLQGALALTVAAQQSSIAALARLPGTIIFRTANQYNVVNTKLEFVASNGDRQVQSIAPDGKHLLYNDNHRTLHLAGVDGSSDHQLSTQQVSGGLWSSDSQKVAFFGEIPGLSIASVTDGAVKPLTIPEMVISQAVWSPDSHHLAFVGQLSEPGKSQTTAIYVAETDGPAGNAHAITTFDTMGQSSPMFGYSSPQWFPDNERLLFSAKTKSSTSAALSWAIVSIKADGTNQTVIHTFAPNELASPFGPSLSPNGKVAYFYAYDPKSPNQNLYFMSLGSGTYKKVATLDFHVGAAPVWSPDGKYLVGEMIDQTLASQPYVANADSGDLLPIKLRSSQSYGLFVWAPDSQSLVTCYSDNVSGQQTGAMFLISIADPGTSVVLVDKPVCPSQWAP